MALKIPPETKLYLDFAVNGALHETKGDKDELVRLLKNLARSYGTKDMIKAGNLAPNPCLHQFYDNCYTAAYSKFLVAKELGFNPTFYTAHNFRQINKKDESEEKNKFDTIINNIIDETDNHGGDHAFIAIEKKGNKQKIIVDQLLSMDGGAKFDLKKKRITVSNPQWHQKEVHTYDFLMELDENDIAERHKFLQSNDGFITMLESGQAIKDGRVGNDRYRLYCMFDKESNVLKTQTQISSAVNPNFGVNWNSYLKKNGEREKEEFEIMFYGHSAWMKLFAQSNFGTFDRNVLDFYGSMLERMIGNMDMLQKPIKNSKSWIINHNYEDIERELRVKNYSNIFNPKNLKQKLPTELECERPYLKELGEIAREGYETMMTNEEFAHFFLNSSTYVKMRKKLIAKVHKGLGNGKPNRLRSRYDNERIKYFKELIDKRAETAKDHTIADCLYGQGLAGAQFGEALPPRHELVENWFKTSNKKNKAKDNYKNHVHLFKNHRTTFRKYVEGNILKRIYPKAFENEKNLAMQDYIKYKKNNDEQMFDLYCVITQELFIRTYQLKPDLRLQGLNKHIQPKIAQYWNDHPDEYAKVSR